jgi:putative membrane protein
VAYLALAMFTLTAVLGYWNFALHPERLPSSPAAVKFFAVSFQFFAQLHIVLASLVLGVLLVRSVGWRWLLALGAVYALSFTSEHVGTGYGIPFGGYSYTGLLGLKVGGRVPALIPLSWFLMALPSWVMARAATASHGSPLPRVALGALWLTVWDLALDPAMSFLTPYWVWEDSGPYYGMPWLNVAGWFVTGLVLMAALDALARRTRLASFSPGWATAYYFLILALPMGMVFAAGLWAAVVVTLAGVAVSGVITLLARSASSPAGAGVVGAPSAAGAR